MWLWGVAVTRMTDTAEREREALENAMAALARAQVLLDAQVSLRVRQAAQRWPGALLESAVVQIDEVAAAVRRAQRHLAEHWQLRTTRGWECSSKERE